MTPRQVRILKAYGLLIAAAAAVGIASGLLLKANPWPPAATILATAALAAVGIAATIPYWRSIDDAAREAKKTAWYWGGGFGALVGLFAAMALGGARSPMALGALLMAGVQVAAYKVVWAGWWLARRPAAA